MLPSANKILVSGFTNKTTGPTPVSPNAYTSHGRIGPVEIDETAPGSHYGVSLARPRARFSAVVIHENPDDYLADPPDSTK